MQCVAKDSRLVGIVGKNFWIDEQLRAFVALAGRPICIPQSMTNCSSVPRSKRATHQKILAEGMSGQGQVRVFSARKIAEAISVLRQLLFRTDLVYEGGGWLSLYGHPTLR